MVRYIHQWLMANDSAEHRLNRTLLHLAEAQPNDAVMTLLRVAPSCDRAAMAMWKTIMSSPRTAKLAQRILLDVLGSWPKHSTRTSDGDKTGVFALAVSFGQWPLLAPKPPLLQLSFLLPPLHLPASGAGLKPGLGAAAGPPVPLLPLCFSGPLPATLGPCHTDTSALSAVSGGLCPLQATVVMWKILQEPCVPHIVKVHSSRVLVHLLFQVFYSTEETPEEVDTFWKGCQEQHGLATSPNRFAVRTLKSLLCLEQYKDVVMAMERRCGWDTLLCADTQHYAVGLLAREMSCISIRSCSRIFRYLLQLLSTQEPRWDLPALAFLVEVLKHLDLSEREADRVLQIFSRHLRSDCRERRRLALKGLLKLTDNPSMTKTMWSLTESLVELLRDADGEIVKITVMVLSFIILDSDRWIGSPIALQLAEALVLLFDLASRETLLCVAEFLKRRDLERLVKKDKFWIFANCL
ncbi:maestro heat-like repeat-containing protein family member 7, partial [Anomalospiza imberbis]|uniref:maestro heat-like repeat-containing protein family member 7 n=1 Tax=Anomalospiza imberbis TaxID=187417 RepID=UPI00358E4987